MADNQTKYSEDVAARVLAALSDGQSLRAISRQDGMPDMVTIWRWIQRHEDFAAKYAEAKQEAADAMVEDMQSISDDPDIASDHKRIMVDTRKWIASKLKAKKYGDKVAVTDADGGPISVTWAVTGQK